ncbi:MAG: hypothetical protein K2Q18_07810, partial [Bdellovibrionales bacterium]|nr:hypothetical protein [Bdellovibrionales bacterium]
MKILPLAVLVALSVPNVILAEDGDEPNGAIVTNVNYAKTVAKDNYKAAMNSLQDLGHKVYTKTAGFFDALGDSVSDVTDSFQTSRAISNGDGVEINARVYSLALRKAENAEGGVKQLKKDQQEREYSLKQAKKEVDGLADLSKDYKKVATDSAYNVGDALVGIAEQTQKLKGWDEAHQKKMDEFVKQHKELGKLTAEDGAGRVGEQMLLSMKESWTSLGDFIKKSPDAAKAAGLEVKFNNMSSVLVKSITRMTEKEGQILTSMGKINTLSKAIEAGAIDEESLQRQTILGTLNNSVNNLITSAEFSKARSQLAFSKFSEIEDSMKKKGVKAGDAKEAYKKN